MSPLPHHHPGSQSSTGAWRRDCGACKRSGARTEVWSGGAPTGQGSWAVLNLEVKEMLATWTGGGRHRRTWGAAQSGGTQER